VPALFVAADHDRLAPKLGVFGLLAGSVKAVLVDM
jgi:hypothetical protein